MGDCLQYMVFTKLKYKKLLLVGICFSFGEGAELKKVKVKSNSQLLWLMTLLGMAREFPPIHASLDHHGKRDCGRRTTSNLYKREILIVPGRGRAKQFLAKLCKLIGY